MENNYRELWSRRLLIIIFVLMTILIVVLAYKLYKERTKTRKIIEIEKPAATSQHVPPTSTVDSKPPRESKKPAETRIYKCISNGKTVYSESPCSNP